MSEDDSVIVLKGPVYDALKVVTTVLFPGLGTLYFAVAQIWGLPFAEQVVGTISAFVLFLGLILRQSSKNYNIVGGEVAGDLVFEQYPNGEIGTMRVEVNRDPFIAEEGKPVKLNPVRLSVPDPDPKLP